MNAIREIALSHGPDINSWPIPALREAITAWLETDREILLQEAVMEMVATEGDCIALMALLKTDSPVARHALVGKLLCHRIDAYAERNLGDYVADRYDDWAQDDHEQALRNEADSVNDYKRAG